MTSAPYVLLFLAFCLVYVPRLFVAREQARMPEGYDNAHPRQQQARLDGFGARAQAAHLNGFEAFAPFAAGVLASLHAGVEARSIVWLGTVFVAARSVYVALYLANRSTARSAVWTVGFLATCALLLAPVLRGG
ncbi:MAG: MAPEG family protein [Deltaproteobacteria bacterium]|nr:MAPEG family protein [Deltaproteobacteria bacterium]